VGYVRLHGRNYRDWFREDAGRDERYDYLYSDEELREWAERIRALAGHVRSVYVIANNHYKGQAACNAIELKSLLAEDLSPPRRRSLRRTPVSDRARSREGRANYPYKDSFSFFVSR